MDKARVILHEVLHQMTMYALSKQTRDWGNSEQLETFRREVNSLFQYVRNRKELQGERGVRDIYEFMAELANPVFREKLKNMDQGNFWQRMLHAIMDFFGFKQDSRYYTRAFNALDNALNAFDIEAYMRYNGLRHLLRPGFSSINTATMTERQLRESAKSTAAFHANREMAAMEETLQQSGTEFADNNTIQTRIRKLAEELKLSKYESRLERNAETSGIQRQTTDGGLLDEAQTRIQRRGSNVRETQEQGVQSQESTRRRNREDEATLEKLAKEQGQWIDNADEELERQYGERIGHGSESYVYLKDADTVIKSRTIDPNIEGGYRTYQEALESIAIHNRLFPETAMTITGFGRSDGEFCVIVEQPFIEGKFATTEEIQQFIADKYEAEKDEEVAGGQSYKTEAYLLQDLKPKNVIVRKVNGKEQLFVIDGDFYLTERHKEYLNLIEQEQDRQTDNDLQSPTPLQQANQLIETMPDQQLRQTIEGIQQEAADYDLVNGIQSEVAKEMQEIKQKAIADGTFMKAPNGKPTKLTERQWLQVRTKNFLNWFGDWINDSANASKIVDENGEPLVVYHNTDNNFTKFSKFRSLIGKLTGSALFGRGFYFSNYQGSSRQINMPVFLNVKNPAEGVMKSENDGMIQDFGNGQVWYVAKNPNQIKSATENQGSFLNESDDIQMAIGNRQTNTFTFNDGTVVNAPFTPNTEQADALNQMDDFIKSPDETSMTLSGYAGTGKTSLMQMLAQKMNIMGRAIVFTATTNQAAQVLKTKVENQGFDAYTVNKAFGISVEVNSEEEYDAKNLVNVLKDSNLIHPGCVVVIDEASMINEEHYAILNDIARMMGLKIIYTGDAGQLAPVKESKISKVFRDNANGRRIVQLTKVERTDDNAILKEATAVRNGEQLSKESSFNEEGKGVAYLKSDNTDDINKIIKHFAPGLKQDPNYFRILAFTNAAVANYNKRMRQVLGYNSLIPNVGEPMAGYASWGYNWGKWRFINSGAYTVKQVYKPYTKSLNLNGRTYEVQAIPITLENAMGEQDTFDFVDIVGNAMNKKVATELARLKKELWRKRKYAPSKREKANILSTIHQVDDLLFVNDNIVEGGKTLQSKVIDFGYALTVHKSQGSTFTNVLIDDVDISTARDDSEYSNDYQAVPDWAEEDDRPMNPDDLVMTDGEEVDAWDDDDTTTPETEGTVSEQDSEDAASMRQQLRYVAISRATDTATIITKGVKTEDSPLNHQKTSKPVSQQNTQQTRQTAQNQAPLTSEQVWQKASEIQSPKGRKEVPYTPPGQQRQTYTVEGNHIYNKEGKEVFKEEGRHRNKIFANLAVQEGRAVTVIHREKTYVVNNKKQIISVQTGEVMKWGEENGDRKTILQLAEQKFRNKLQQRTQEEISKQVDSIIEDARRGITTELVSHLKTIEGVNVFGRKAMEQFIREHGLGGLQQNIQIQKEMQDIKKQLVASGMMSEDGTKRLAPNGKQSNLNERQYLQVRTKAFKKWFGDWENNPANASKVVDKNGEPLVVYHGTNTEFTVFDPEKGDGEHKAFYFTNSKEMAASYKGGNILMPVFLNIRDTYNINAEGKTWNNITLDFAVNSKTPTEFAQNVLKQQAVEVETAKHGYFDEFWGRFVKDENYTKTRLELINSQYLPKLYRKYQELYKQTTKNPIKAIKRILEMKSIEKRIKSIFENDYYRRSYGTIDKVSTRDLDLVLNDKEGIIIKNVIDYGTKVDNPKANDVYIAYFPNQVKSATDNIGTFSTENDDIQMAVKFYGKENPYHNKQKANKEQRDEIINQILHKEYNASGTDILKVGNQLFLIDHTSIDDLNKNFVKDGKISDGEGYGIRKKYNFAKLTETNLNEIIRNIASDYRNSETTIQHRLQELGITAEQLSGIDITAAIQRGAGNNGQVDAQAGGQRIQANTDRSSTDSGENQRVLSESLKSAMRLWESMGFNADEMLSDDVDMPFFTTPEGEVYGFVDKEGNIYLDEEVISPEHPLHEYTHLWDRVVAKKNPKLWKHGIQLMKKISLWNEIANDANYGAKWKQMNMAESKLEQLIASEVHARLVGEGGQALLDTIAQQKGAKRIVAKLKQWILDFWKNLKATFSNFTDDELSKLTLKDFNHMTVRDFADTGEGLYLVDHTDKEGIDNRTENQEGFQCVMKVDTEGLNKKQIEDIKNEYQRTKETPRRFNDWLERNEYSDRLSSSDSIVAQVRKSNTDNAGLHNEASQGESSRGRSDRSSQENLGTSWIKTSADGINSPRYIPVSTSRQSAQDRQSMVNEFRQLKEQAERGELTQLFIGKKARTQFEQQLQKARPDMSDKEIEATLNLLHLMKDNKENTAYIKDVVRWIANKGMDILIDQEKAMQAFKEARKRHIDTGKFRTLNDLITSPEMAPKEKERKPFDPDKAKTFSNKRTVTTESGREFTVYDVEDTEEGQKEVCKAVAAHYSTSPWCLSTFTATGEPTQSTRRYWFEVYNKEPRKIAFEDSRPVAFTPRTNKNYDISKVISYQMFFLHDLSLHKTMHLIIS